MRLFFKVFLCTLFILTIALGAAGYYMISTSFNTALDRETDRALEQYQLLKFSLQSAILGAYEMGSLSDETMTAFSQQTVQLAPESTLVGIYGGESQNKIASSSTVPWGIEDIRDIPQDELQYSLLSTEAGSYYLVILGSFMQSSETITVCTARNIDMVFMERSSLIQAYQTIYGIVICISAIVILSLFTVLMRPMEKLTKATIRIAGGDYSERVKVTTKDEIGMLGARFNLMATTIEDKIYELKRNAQQKEDFVANFAHELKTPLTSVIGYADMIYQKDLSRQQVRDAASFIINEGMHLEALSFKLLELVILGKEDFILEEFKADELLSDIAVSLAPLMKKYGARLTLTAHATYVRVEYDLLKTLIQNLIDNAVKAEGKDIRLIGRLADNQYTIIVADDGRGISESDLSRITEAFYMVDKSRSRKQHGAGLGLSIAARIAQIHGSQLRYASKLGEGTVVSFALPIEVAEHEA